MVRLSISGSKYERFGRALNSRRKGTATMQTDSRETSKDGEDAADQLPALLLIDDNAIQAATRQTILRRAGYHVIAGLNPCRALEQFRQDEFPVAIQLVITDHLMPDMSGAAFVTELRKLRPELPVLVISGLEEAESQYTGMGVTFRVKQLMPDHLLSTVQQLIEH